MNFHLTDSFTGATATVTDAAEMLDTLNAWNPGLEAGYFTPIVEDVFHGDQGRGLEALAANGVTSH